FFPSRSPSRTLPLARAALKQTSRPRPGRTVWAVNPRTQPARRVAMRLATRATRSSGRSTDRRGRGRSPRARRPRFDPPTARPGPEDRQGAHEERPLAGHLRDRVRVELESVFEGIDAGVDPDPGADEETGMRGDLRAATVREFDDGPHVVRRPRRLFLLRSIE